MKEIIDPKETIVVLQDSNGKLKTLINSLPGMVFYSTYNGNFTMRYISEGCWQLTGYSSQELLKINYYQTIHREDFPRLLGEIQKAISLSSAKLCAFQQSYAVEYRIHTKSGKEKWVWEKGTVVSQENGEIGSIEGFITDITKLKQTEESLRESEERYRLLAENSTDMISRHTLKGDYLYVSPACHSLLGYQSRELVGRSLYELCHPADLQAIKQAHRKVLEPRIINTITSRMRHKNGHYIWLETTSNLVQEANTEVVGEIIAISRDISSRKQAENLLAAQNQILEKIASNAPLREILKAIIDKIERESNRMLAAIWLLDENSKQLYNGSAPSLPVSYITKINSMIGRGPGYHLWKCSPATYTPTLSPCSLAIHRRETVIVADIANDSEAIAYRDLALSYGIQSCWSTPIFSSQGKVLGSFAIYYNEPTTPTVVEKQLMETATHLAGIAIERKQKEEALLQGSAKYRSIFEHISLGIFQTSVDGSYISANSALAKIYGYNSPQELMTNLTDIEHQLYVNPNRRAELNALLQQQGMLLDFESEVYRQDGTIIWIAENVRAVYNESGQFLYYEGTVEDITARHVAQEKLHYSAFHDSLTRLPNRAWLMKHLGSVLKGNNQGSNSVYAILFVDLDRFKVVNDSFGHLVGDKLLQSVADRLRDCLSPEDSIARFGGDEFAILLENLADVEDAITVAKIIQTELSKPFQVNDYEIFTGASIGITLSTLGYEHPENMLRDADIAMYQAKVEEKGSYALFHPAMQVGIMTRFQLENYLRRAIKLNELQVYYQPIISLTTGCLTGFEALSRWHHPLHGLISPDKFIPIAEESGLIKSIGWLVFSEACHQLKQWQQQFEGAATLTMNINVSTYQLKQMDFVEEIEEYLGRIGLKGNLVKLEITESGFLETVTGENTTLAQLKALGIQLCIDDFGTGYSSLSRLHEFPMDTLKIDRSFVSRLDSSGNNNSMIETIISLAHSLGMNVVAEGIESQQQLEQLKQLRCEYGQGYLFSRPVNSQKASILLEQWSPNNIING